MPRRSKPTILTHRVGIRIRELRLELGLSITQLAEATATTKGHLSDVEHGLVALSITTIHKLAVGLKVPPLFLITFAERSPVEEVVELLRKMPASDVSQLVRTLVESTRRPIV